jgi:hypothetical protein
MCLPQGQAGYHWRGEWHLWRHGQVGLLGTVRPLLVGADKIGNAPQLLRKLRYSLWEALPTWPQIKLIERVERIEQYRRQVWWVEASWRISQPSGQERPPPTIPAGYAEL